jgi:hypothetical protein
MSRYTWSRWLPSKLRSGRRGKRGARRAVSPLVLEPLEMRLVPSTIKWVNEGTSSNDSDGFGSVFGTNASLARGVVQAAITSWQRVIANFNYSDGSDEYDLTINMASGGTSNGANAGPTGSINGKPNQGSMTVGRGGDTNGDGVGDGAGYFLDPTPLDNSEFEGTIANAFSGYASPTLPDGSTNPAYNQADLFEVVLHEMGHAFGFTGGSYDLPSSGLETNTNVADTIDGTVGYYYRFDGADVSHLMTSFDSGGQSSGPFDAGIGWHSAPPGASVTVNGTTYSGVDELMTAYYTNSQRRLISDPMALMLKDAYGYTVNLPSSFGTYYAVLEQSTGRVLVRGGSNSSNDTIIVSTSGTNLVVSVDLGNDIPGTGALAGPGDLPAFVSKFPLSGVSSVAIQAGDGDDTIQIGKGTLAGMPQVTVDGGSGTNTLTVDDHLASGSTTTSVFSGFLAASDGGLVDYSSNNFRTITLKTGTGGATVNVYGTEPSGTTAITGNGYSIVNVGSGLHSTQGIQGALVVSDPPNYTDLTIDDSGDGNGHTATLTPNQLSGLSQGTIGFVPGNLRSLTIDCGAGTDTLQVGGGNLAGMPQVTVDGGGGTNGLIIDDHSSTGTNTTEVFDYQVSPSDSSSIFYHGNTFQSLTLKTGKGSNTVDVFGTPSGTTTTITGNGPSAVNVGSTMYNTQSVRGPLVVNNPPNFTDVTIDDSQDGAAHAVTVSARQVLGLTTGGISFTPQDLRSLTINAGSGGNTFTALNTPYPQTTLTTGLGNDQVTVRASTGPLTLNGGGGSDRVTLGYLGSVLNLGNVTVGNAGFGLGSTALTVDDSADATQHTGVVIGAGAITGLTQASLGTSGGISSLVVKGGTASNTFTITGTPASTTLTQAGQSTDRVYVQGTANPLTVHGGGGFNYFYAGNTANRLEDIQAPVSFVSNGAINDLEADDQGTFTIRTYTITSTSLARTGTGIIHYQGLSDMFVNGGNGLDVFHIQSNSGFLTVNGGSGNDTFTLADNAGTLNGIAGAVTVHGGGGTDAVNLTDVGNTAGRSYNSVYFSWLTQLGWGGGAVRYYDIATLTLRAGSGNNTFDINGTPSTTFVYTGSGNDQVTVRATNQPLAIVGQGGANTVLVGNAGSMAGIAGNVTISNSGSTQVTIDDSSDTANHSVLFGLVGIAGFSQGIVYYGATSGTNVLTVNGGSGSNTYNVSFTRAGVATTLNTGSGADSTVIGSAHQVSGIQGPLTVNGQGSFQILSYSDQASPTGPSYDYEVTSTTLTRTGIAPVTYHGMTAVSLAGANAYSSNVFGVATTAAGTSYTITSGTGTNEFLVFDTNRTLDGIQGSLLLHAAGGASGNNNFVEVLDSWNTNNQTFLLTTAGSPQSGAIKRFEPVSGQADMAPIAFLGMNAYAVLETGSGSNAVNVQSEAAGTVELIVMGGGGAVTVGSRAPATGGSLSRIVGDVSVRSTPSQAVQVTLDDSGNTTTGARTVSLGSDPTFGYLVSGLGNGSSGRGRFGLSLNAASSVSILSGSQDDTFHFQDFVNAPALTIYGGGGTNTLDYSAYTGDVTVDLPRGVATGLTGIANFENVTGSQGNNLLVGDAGANVLIGGTGRNILIGGSGADTLTGSGGDNLLIAGTTSYDQDLSALSQVMQEWLQPSDFATRMAALQNGTDLLAGTGIHLASDTVFSDGAANVLNPGPGNNWLFS